MFEVIDGKFCLWAYCVYQYISLMGMDTFMIVWAHAICSRAADCAADFRADPSGRYRP